MVTKQSHLFSCANWYLECTWTSKFQKLHLCLHGNRRTQVPFAKPVLMRWRTSSFQAASYRLEPSGCFKPKFTWGLGDKMPNKGSLKVDCIGNSEFTKCALWLYCTQGRELKLEDFDPQTGEAVYRVRVSGWRCLKKSCLCFVIKTWSNQIWLNVLFAGNIPEGPQCFSQTRCGRFKFFSCRPIRAQKPSVMEVAEKSGSQPSDRWLTR